MNSTYKVNTRTFNTLAEAEEYCHRIWRSRGSVLGITEIKPRRKQLDAYEMEQDRLKQVSHGAHE